VVRTPRNDIRQQADIRRIILLYKLPFQSLMLGLGLGFKANVFGLGLGLKAQVGKSLALALALPPKALASLPGLGLVITTGYGPAKGKRKVGSLPQWHRCRLSGRNWCEFTQKKILLGASHVQTNWASHGEEFGPNTHQICPCHVLMSLKMLFFDTLHTA